MLSAKTLDIAEYRRGRSVLRNDWKFYKIKSDQTRLTARLLKDYIAGSRF